jgi:hypothetical protein
LAVLIAAATVGCAEAKLDIGPFKAVSVEVRGTDERRKKDR